MTQKGAGSLSQAVGQKVRQLAHELQRTTKATADIVVTKVSYGEAAADVNANTTTISGGKIATGNITSTNYSYVSGNFTAAGSRFDLDNGTIRTPGLFVDGATGGVSVKGDIAATEFSLYDGANEVAVFGARVGTFSDGHSIDYADPTWTNVNTYSYLLWSGYHDPVALVDTASTQLRTFAQDTRCTLDLHSADNGQARMSSYNQNDLISSEVTATTGGVTSRGATVASTSLFTASAMPLTFPIVYNAKSSIYVDIDEVSDEAVVEMAAEGLGGTSRFTMASKDGTFVDHRTTLTTGKFIVNGIRHDSGAWTNVGFENFFSNFGAPFGSVQYRREGDRVHLRGMIKRASAAAITYLRMFTIPVGLRPPSVVKATCISFNADAAGVNKAIEVDIGADGAVQTSSTIGANFWLSFECSWSLTA